MSQTKYSIYSQSMVLLRADPVSSWEDGTNEADIGAEMYETWAKDVLARHTWSFCRKRVQLTRENKTQPGWQYLYKVPAEALRIFGVYASDAVSTPPFKNFEIVADAAGQYVACNEEQVWALYTFYAPEAVWPAWFVEFAVYALAAHVAVPVTDNDDLEGKMAQKAYGIVQDGEKGGKFAKAAAISDQQSPPQAYQYNEIIAARFS